MATNWLELLESVLTPVLVALILVLAKRAELLILKHVQDAEVQRILLRAGDELFDVVGELQQTLVSEFKARSKDGKLSPDDKKQLLSLAVARWKALQGEEGVRRMREIIGGSGMLDRWLTNKIEASVARFKVGAKAPSPLPPL